MATITEVKDIVTGYKETYVNSYGIKHNLATRVILLETGSVSSIHDTLEREKAEKLIEKIESKNGGIFYFCHKYDLVAKEIQ